MIEIKDMKSYRYDLIGADLNFGVKEHPQIQMKKLGFNVVKAEPVPIADCWIFIVENDIKNVPEYLKDISNCWNQEKGADRND